MQCLKRCFGWNDNSVIQDTGDVVIEEDPRALIQPHEEPGCLGRMWLWLNEPGTRKCNLAVRGVMGALSLTALTVTAVFTTKLFQQDEQYHSRSMFFGTGFGITATVLTGCLLPMTFATAFADWLSRWSYEGLQILTQFYLNGGCPIDGNGFWDPAHVPLAVKELAMIIFTGVSVSIALLSLRSILFPKQDTNPNVPINAVGYGGLYVQNPKPIPLLESGKNDTKWFLAEQFVKGATGATLLGLAGSGVVTTPELLYLGYYLTSHVGGIAAGTLFSFLRDKVQENCPMRQGSIEKIEKIASVIKTCGYGIVFAWPHSLSFVPLGLLSGVSKAMALRTFQLLKENDEVVTPFEWKRVDNIAKAALAGLILAWYISGMTDVGLQSQDYINIITYLSSIATSYPLTRYFAGEFDPQKNNRLFNTLRFYFVNHNEVLMLPYMLIRSAQSIGDTQKNPAWVTGTLDTIAWASLGLASGNNRALMGIRSDQQPNEMSALAQLIAWFILASQGKFR